jgi:hypothetical protein
MEEKSVSAPCTVVRFPQVNAFGSDHRMYPHAVQFYLKEDFLLNIVCDLVASALKARDGALIVATEAHRNRILQLLKLRGVDVDAFKRNKSYVEMDADETLARFMTNDGPDFALFERILGGAITAAKEACGAEQPHVMIFGELVDVLWTKRDLAAALAVEQFWGALAHTFSFSLLCAYSISEFAEAGTEDSFLRICAQHSTVSPPEAYATAESEQRILQATARSYTDASFAEALRSTRPSAGAEKGRPQR